MRSVLDSLEVMEALHLTGQPTPLDHTRRIIVFVVNSLSTPRTTWDKSESPPGTLEILVKATGVPIDHYSYEATELLKDSQSRWQSMRRLRASSALASNKDAAVTAAVRTPDATIYAIDVSFARLEDQAELAYLNELPTSFSLPAEAVDRLRAAAGKIILSSPDFQRLLQDVGARIVTDQAPGTHPAGTNQ
jgi:NTE family protein